MEKKDIDRNEKFKLGCWHGVFQAGKQSSEVYTQRILVKLQCLMIRENQDPVKNPIVRIIGYEIPLQSGKSRGRCVDLMGYDKDHNLWLIELKQKSNKEPLDKIIEQINDYEARVSRIKQNIEKEFGEKYYYPLKFNKIKKLILAPEDFYKRKEKPVNFDKTIYYGFHRPLKSKEYVVVNLIRKWDKQ
jgi:hypothetical protein